MNIWLSGVSVRRGRRRVLDNVELHFPSAVTSVMGLNGSGKSTLLQVLVGAVPHSGNIYFDGREVDRRSADWLRTVTGYAPQSVDWPGSMTVIDVCTLAAFLRRVPQNLIASSVDRALHLADATEFSQQRFRTLSGGQRRRTSLAQAMVHRPEVVVLDEPTSELDPVFCAEFTQTVRHLASSHKLIMSTHSVEDAVRWGGDVVLLDAGSVQVLVTEETARVDDRRGVVADAFKGVRGAVHA